MNKIICIIIAAMLVGCLPKPKHVTDSDIEKHLKAQQCQFTGQFVGQHAVRVYKCVNGELYTRSEIFNIVARQKYPENFE